VLPIGGLKEKVMAAHRGGIKTIVIPKENEKDVEDIPAQILKNLTILKVEHMDEILRHALVLSDHDAFFKQRQADALALLTVDRDDKVPLADEDDGQENPVVSPNLS
jgi:ATP-dependent Lon protease